MGSSRQPRRWGRRTAAAGSPGQLPPERNPWRRVPWWLYALGALVVIVVVSLVAQPRTTSKPGPTVTVTETETTAAPTVTYTETIEATAPADVEGDAPIPTEDTAEPSEPAASSDAGYVYYENCDAAREAGAAPLYRGEPGYRAELDRNRDGVACEL